MKKSTLLAVSALGLGVLFASCSNSEGEANKQQLYNNFSKVDSEGFTFFKTAYEKASYERDFAKYAATQSSSLKSLTDSIVAVYNEILPQLESLAAEAHVLLPDAGAQVFSSEELFSDSTKTFDATAYQARFVEEQKEIVEQFKRVSRNTYSPIRDYSNEVSSRLKDLFIQAGGVEDTGAHH